MALNTRLVENLDGSLTSVSSQDTQEIRDIVTENTRYREEGSRSGRHQYKGDTQFSHKVASIPMIMVEQMMRDGVWNNQERMREWLNNPENAPFRTTKGKL
jgi:hypothetical protein